jgi:kinetochor protein Mis14/NSL1
MRKKHPHQQEYHDNHQLTDAMASAPTIFETDTLTGPRATASAHRKVELQAPADLAYLIANVSRAARTKIDTHLPPDAAPESGEDALRRRVEALVEEYIRQTFEGAKEGMEINGMGAGEMEEVLKRVGEGEGEFCRRLHFPFMDLVGELGRVLF